MISPLIDALENTLVSLPVFSGFRFRKSHQDFIKRVPRRVHAIHFVYIRHSIDFDFTCAVAIRFTEVENILNKDRLFLSETEKRNSFTIGAELGNLKQGSQQRWSVASISDIDYVTRDVASWIDEIALPFLQTYSDLTYTLNAIQNPKIGQLIAPLNREATVEA